MARIGFSGARGVDTRAVTLVVAASDSLYPKKADYQCDGVNDHIEIQAALDALPATGGEVKLLDGTYNCEVNCGRNISNITVRGQGRNTILTTSTADLIFFSFVGAPGAELTGIVIADLQIDGATISECGIYFEYVDYSFIQNVYSRRTALGAGTFRAGIYLNLSDFNTVIGNTCTEDRIGIALYTATYNIVSFNLCKDNALWDIDLEASANKNTVSDNICLDNGDVAIYLAAVNDNIISSNICRGSITDGIFINGGNSNTIIGNNCFENGYSGITLVGGTFNNTISGNTCRGNGAHGIRLNPGNNNTIAGNTCAGNSQTTDNTYHNIALTSSSYNLITGNLCRDGGGANQPKYGINISDDASNRNCLIGNDLYDSGKTGDLNDVPVTNPTLKHDNRNLAGTGWLPEV